MTGPIADDGAALSAWMQRSGITEIRVVSPHLDDAAFSLASFFARQRLPPRRVMTVFTEAGPMTRSDHALAMGFADTQAEFAGRRAEDIAAMRRLGTGFVHCGLESGKLDAASAGSMIQTVLNGLATAPALVLLPLGAGGSLSGVARFTRRVLRVPPGCGIHGDHVWVRDHLRDAIGPTIAKVGFYAEIPYQWANTGKELATQARRLAAGPVDAFLLTPDIDAKLAVVQDYASQIDAEFGIKQRYQRRTVSIAERIFLPVQTAMPTQFPPHAATSEGRQ